MALTLQYISSAASTADQTTYDFGNFSAGSDRRPDDRRDGGPGGGGSSTVPVNQVAVPLSREWVLKRTGAGLRGELPIVVNAGTTGLLYAVNFRNDLPNNGRLSDVAVPTVLSGTEGGITLGETQPDDLGVNESKVIVRIDCDEEGDYLIEVVPTYDAASGGGDVPAIVRLIVV